MDLHFNKSKMTKCQDVESNSRYDTRLNIRQEVDRVAGQPIFPSSITIVTGESGTGKTTFLLQVCNEHAKLHRKVGYISGEQNISFLKKICDNCNVKDVELGNISDVDDICDLIPEYSVMVVDSFPCIKCNETKYGKMTVTRRDQFILEKLAVAAQSSNSALFIVLHATKTGEYKGSTFFKHIVDNMITLRKDHGVVLACLEKSRLSPASSVTLHMYGHGFDEFYDKVLYKWNDHQFQFAYNNSMRLVNEFLENESVAWPKKWWKKFNSNIWKEVYFKNLQQVRIKGSTEYNQIVNKLKGNELKSYLTIIKQYYYERLQHEQWDTYVANLNARLKTAENIHIQLNFK